MLAGTVLYSTMTYLVMWVGYGAVRWNRRLHITIMAAVIASDIGMPFYLYATRDWYGRLIKHMEIMTFPVWMHVFLLIALYVLYGLQIFAGVRMLRNAGDTTARSEHRGQAKALLVIRALVVISGAFLVEPGVK